MSIFSTLPMPTPGRRQGAESDARAQGRRRQRRIALIPVATASLEAVLAVCIVIVVLLLRHGTPPLSSMLPTSLLVAGLTVGISLIRHDYALDTLAARSGTVERAIIAWSLAFGVAAVISSIADANAGSLEIRGATGLIFVGGLVAVSSTRLIVNRLLRSRLVAGALSTQRLMLVTTEQGAASLSSAPVRARSGRIVGTSILRDDPASRTEDLALTVAIARMLSPDDIVLALPWEDPRLIEAAVAALSQLPATIHLGPPVAFGGSSSLRDLELVPRPLSPVDLRVKRLIDIGVSSVALVLLSPLFLLVAIAIKLESRGPVMFLQRRYGFNQQPFRIIKFRSMTVMEDSASLRQVTTGDRRVTRVGRFLRRSSIDELPQLFNVLKGDMSLIGPRPHALAHDQQFERMIQLYGRRHNVRPGITGWAQVNGFRGEIDAPDKIEGRIRHDLDYIDNWSLWLDVSILFRTVFSSKTFHNAK